MAYSVLLSFDDEEEALTFVEKAMDNEVFKQYPDGTPDDFEVLPTGKVVAIYKQPTMFCQTAGGCTSGGRRSGGYTMGKKWGWWVCSICMKPSELYWKSVMEEHSSFGRNLLKKLFTDDEV